MFLLADSSGDGNGYISIPEFKQLAERIGVHVSEHRIVEIFARVKGKNLNTFRDDELDQKEFEKALSYLQEKSLI